MTYCRRCLSPVVTDLDPADENILCPACKDSEQEIVRAWADLSSDEKLAFITAASYNVNRRDYFDS